MYNLGNPQALINSMWLIMTTHFGLRGRQEHTTMQWGDLTLQADAKGTEFVEFNERSTKTRQGATRDTRAFRPRMYATGNSLVLCNVSFLLSFPLNKSCQSV